MKKNLIRYGIVTTDRNGFTELDVDSDGSPTNFATKKAATVFGNELVDYEEFNQKNQIVKKAKAVKIKLEVVV